MRRAVGWEASALRLEQLQVVLASGAVTRGGAFFALDVGGASGLVGPSSFVPSTAESPELTV